MWNNRDRINRKCTINTVENGGVNVIDVRSKIQSLKIPWLIRWSKSPLWEPVTEAFLKKIDCSLQMLLHMNIKSLVDFPILSNLPSFYQELWLAFYAYKSAKPVRLMSDYDFLSQVVWGNPIFKFQNKCIHFENWIKGGIIYVKDLFDIQGNFHNEGFILSKIPSKRDWIREYTTVKRVLKPYLALFNTSLANFVNIKKTNDILFYNKNKNVTVPLLTLKSNDIYHTLILKIATRHYMEKNWCSKFDKKFNHDDWRLIYRRKVGGILCKKLSEFNYKIIHNLVYTGYILSKWKFGISSKCVVCGENEMVEHMLFECDRVKHVWKRVGEILKLDISWHHIVLGLDEINAKQINVTRNNIITIITYSIYALWVKCGETKESFKYLNITKMCTTICITM